jgi:hypothetical protein
LSERMRDLDRLLATRLTHRAERPSCGFPACHTAQVGTIVSKAHNVSFFRVGMVFLLKNLRGLVRQRIIPTERPPLLAEVSANIFLTDRGCRVVSATNPHGR